MIGLEYFLLGYFLIQPEKEQMAKVLDLLFSMRIGARQTKNGALLLRKRHRKNLAPILDSIGVSCTVEKGLPDFICKNRKRYAIFSALLICAAMLVFMSGRVFEIRVLGIEGEAETGVMSALENAGLYPGAPFRSLDFSEIENELKEACPYIAWVNAHRRGTVVYVNVIEGEEENPPSSVSLSNLVAREDCVIVSVSPDSGVACVKVGDAVRAGDLLVSAIHPDGTLSGASGEVLGRVEGQILSCAMFEESKITLQRQKNVEITLNFFGFSINIFKNYRNLPIGCDIIENTEQLRLLGRATLPISRTVQTAYLPKTETVTLTEEETVRLAEVRLRTAMNELLPMGEIVRLQTEGHFTEQGYVFILHYAQIRNVAEPKPIRAD